MTIIEREGFRWLEQGRGEPVLFLHGLMGGVDDWRPAIEHLKTAYRPLALALPIFDDRSEPSIAALSNHVSGFLTMLGVRRAILGGNSLGGHVALRLALTEPDRVRGLILTGSSGLSYRSGSCSVPRSLSSAFLRQRIEEVFFDRTLVTNELVESVRRVLRPLPSLLRALRLLRDTRVSAVEGRLHEISAPTLLVWGNDDRITPVAHAGKRFRELMPRSELVIVPSCGHAPMIERPALFSAAVREWLTAASGATAVAV